MYTYIHTRIGSFTYIRGRVLAPTYKKFINQAINKIGERQNLDKE